MSSRTKSLYHKAALQAGLQAVGPEEMRELKGVLLGMMDEFLAVCQRHRLTVMMRSGTLLGAARHKGFIPWDDDLDFMMPRKDYDRFLEVFDREMGQAYVVQTPRTEPNACFGFMKIRKKGTAFVEVETAGLPIHKGLFLDVFPLENAPASRTGRFFHGLACILLKQITTATALYRYPSAPMKVLRKHSGKLNRLLAMREGLGFLFSFFSVGWWNRATENLCARYRHRPSQFLVAPYGGKGYFGEVYPREVFFPTVLLPFEGRQLPAPGQWEQWLLTKYGNFMQVPADGSREIHWVAEWSLASAVQQQERK
jgi:lipopolysaccharide cholinephosphotransferase